ncbi:MAG: DUF4132 domain-containing protein [Kibdelosporangium sp.]
MDRWEFFADGSAKFWEIGQDGVTVTVRFGRLGAAGQTKDKSFASAAEAAAHVTKLVAEKEKKGYQAVGALVAAPDADPVPTEAPVEVEVPAAVEPPPEEDVLVLPEDWRPDFVSRRGGFVREVVPDPDAAAFLAAKLAEVQARIEIVLRCQGSDASLVREVRSYLAGQATPLGAAAVLALLESEHSPGEVRSLSRLADGLVARHGLVFAAQTAVESTRVEVHFSLSMNKETPHELVFRQRGRSWRASELIDRLRDIVVAADQAGYEAVVAGLAKFRTDLLAQMVVSYLVASEVEWVDEVCANAIASDPHEYRDWRLLHYSLSTVAQLESIAAHEHVAGWSLRRTNVLHALAEIIGPGIAPTVARFLDRDPNGGDTRKALLDVLAGLPTEQTFDLLIARLDQKHVHPVLTGLMRRYPVRALRRLAAANARQADLLLRDHVLTNRDVLGAALPADVTAVVERVMAAHQRVPEAPDSRLPPVLVTPPWLVKRQRVKPVVLAGLTPPGYSTTAWQPGEQAQWATSDSEFARGRGTRDWAKAAQDFKAGQRSWYRDAEFFIHGPVELTGPLIGDWRPDSWQAADWGRLVVAGHGLPALPAILHTATASPAANGELLLPFADGDLARLMAEWLVRLKSARPIALAWFARHGAAVAGQLVPNAVGKPGTARTYAEEALRRIAFVSGSDVVRSAARSYGAEAEQAIETLLVSDPLDMLPAKIPVPGDWADATLLPQILLRDRQSALPVTATRHLITMFALSQKDETYPGVAIVSDLADPESLARFVWDLFERWQGAGAPAKESWALWALGWFGDDQVVRLLTPLIRAWPGSGGHAKAVTGLDVLAEIGTDVALTHLNSIAQKVPFKALKQRAQEKIAAVAADLGLDPDQLADRLVPAFGLDEAATAVIDYGTRRFVVGFDEQLKPYVADEDGKRRKDLPKPGARDDQELAPAEYKRFSVLKKDVRTVAADQISRLETAMVSQRSWTAAEFTDLLAGHPLLWHIVRRLVWLTDKDIGFRLAEDRTLADVNDDTFVLPEDAEVTLAHPLHLAGTLRAWSEIFADYEILQPFPQLGRPVHACTPDESTDTRLRRFENAQVPVGRLLGLTKRGWQRGTPQDAGVECWILRPVPGGGSVVVNLDPGIAVGVVDMFPEQTLSSIWLSEHSGGDWSPRGTRTFGELDPVTASEVLAEFTGLTS